MRTLIALLLALPLAALAQYPARAVRVIVPFPAGSTPEALAERVRADAEKWSRVIQAANIRID